MATTHDGTEQYRDAIGDVRQAAETSREVTAVRSAGFWLLLNAGMPVEKSTWAAKAGLTLAELDELLASASVKGRVQMSADGLLLGIAGLTVEPTVHRIDVDGATRYTWCALDAVGIFGALGVSGSVHSTDPGTGRRINISFADGKPVDQATIFILGGYDGGKAVTEWCPLVNFFETHDDAESWVHRRGLEGDIVSVGTIAEESAAMWRPVVEAGSR